MTPREAISIIRNEELCVKTADACGRDCGNCPLVLPEHSILEAYETAVEALEKQIRKRAVGEHYAHMRCPGCNHRIPSGGGSSSRRRDNWCNYCGQAIDWG